MSKAKIFLADGMEEVECLAVVDMLKRGGAETEMISVMGRKAVTGSHGITVLADRIFEEADFSDTDILFLPGGVPGTPNLAAHEGLTALIREFAAADKRLAAICAAPSILGDMGLPEGRTATCYPGFESHLTGANYTSQGVITDGNITTARGVGFAIDLGPELVRLLEGERVSQRVKADIRHP